MHSMISKVSKISNYVIMSRSCYRMAPVKISTQSSSKEMETLLQGGSRSESKLRQPKRSSLARFRWLTGWILAKQMDQ